jgi:hypothetical protein
VADLVAIRKDGQVYNNRSLRYEDRQEILFVSCKIPEYAPPAERKALLEAAERCGAKAVMTVKDKAGKWVLQTVDS